MKRAAVVIAALLAAACIAAGARAWEFHDAAKPGVHVLGFDVSGKSRSQIVDAVHRWGAQAVTIRAPSQALTRMPPPWTATLRSPSANSSASSPSTKTGARPRKCTPTTGASAVTWRARSASEGMAASDMLMRSSLLIWAERSRGRCSIPAHARST